ncbi:MAG: ACP S-malonyltransferase [Halothiobacillaceae bacterium]|nr:ACP S-malonyltransferase [Halothiobacillaceae bacterium]MDY0049234.1 ACP S-malonyltransferase [Halothiobacillaceae bacterium]
MKFACVFPGQGSQSVGMLADWAATNPLIVDTFQEAGDALGLDLWARVSTGPEDELNRTEITQPAMLAAGIAVWRSWKAAGGADPAFLAGHSLGEYSALVAAGSLDFADAVRLVAERGRLMQAAVPAGAGGMAAILGLDDADVVAVCAQAADGQVVEAVNFNSPGQVVIAGDAAAVKRASGLAMERGAKRVVPLSVSVPSHSSLMEPAARELAAVLEKVELREPRLPVLHNVDAGTRQAPAAIREALVAQLHRPVRWTECVQALRGRGVNTLLEMGPGKVLAGLTRRIDRELSGVPVLDEASLRAALEQTGA